MEINAQLTFNDSNCFNIELKVKEFFLMMKYILKHEFLSLKQSVSVFIKIIKRCINELYSFCKFYIVNIKSLGKSS